MLIQIENKSPVPIYSQITDQFKHLIATGKLLPGDRVPTIRELAVQLEINPNTVAKAYLEMQNLGILETKQGTGTFVKYFEDKIPTLEKEGHLNILSKKFLDEALRLGYSKADILKSIKNILNKF